MLIRFDYINLVVCENNVGCNGIGGPRIPAEDLRLLFWYFNSSPADKQEISKGHFDLNRARITYETMTSLLGYAKEFNHSTLKSKKLERILGSYEKIQLN